MTTLINKRDNFALSVSAILQFLWKVCKNLKLDPVISSISTSAESKKSVKLRYGCSKAGYQQEFRGKNRTEQDLNLRGQSPLDFESNALTTRPSVLAIDPMRNKHHQTQDIQLTWDVNRIRCHCPCVFKFTQLSHINQLDFTYTIRIQYINTYSTTV